MNKTPLAGILAFLIGFGAAPVYAQTPPAAGTVPKLVLSQTIRGVTVTLSGVRWIAVEPTDPRFDYSKLLLVPYSIKSDRPQVLPRGKSLLDGITTATLIAPDGARQAGSGGGWSADATGARIAAESSWDKVDPRWPLVGIDVEFQDPSAPARAAGRSDLPITISGIPVPQEVDKVTTVHAETTTPLGTRVIVEKVKVSPKADGTKTTFVFRFVPDAAASDLRFTFTANCKAVDDTGAMMGKGSMMGTGDALGEDGRHGLGTVGVSGVPTPGAKTMSLTLDATEASEALQDDPYYRHFHLLLPLKSLYAGPLRAYPPLMTRTGQNVTGLIETLKRAWESDRMRLVLHDRTDPSVRWEAREVRATNDAGGTAIGEKYTQIGQEDFFWKVDGQALSPGDSACVVDLGGPNGPFTLGGSTPASAGTLTVAVDAKACRLRNHVLDFVKVPVPAEGQTLTVDRAVTDVYGGRLVLRKIAAYSPAHPLLPGAVPSGDAPPSGLAVVLAEPPAGPKDAPSVDYFVVAANDTKGRRLPPLALYARADGDTLSGASQAKPSDTARVITLFLRPAVAGAKTFNLRMGRLEQIDLHKQETLTFSNIPAPPKSSAP